jgi:hypothetical protein
MMIDDVETKEKKSEKKRGENNIKMNGSQNTLSGLTIRRIILNDRARVDEITALFGRENLREYPD